MMPSQKDGVARPAIEKLRTTRSIQLFCLSAEIVPSGIAIDDGDDRRHDRDFERDRQAGRDLDDDRLARPHRVAEIEARPSPT